MAVSIEKNLPYYDIESAVSEGSFTEIKTYTEDAIRYVEKLLHLNEYLPLKNHLAHEQRAIEWLYDQYTSNENIEFFIGYYAGLLKLYQKELIDCSKAEQAEHLFDDFPHSTLPHLNEILYAIEAHEGIRHGVLAQTVGIEKSTLTGIMEKIVDLGVVTFSRPGKFKYYYLTEKGKNYCTHNRAHFQATKDIDIVLEELLECIERDADPQSVIVKICQTLFERKPLSPKRAAMSKTEMKSVLLQAINYCKPQLNLSSDPQNRTYKVEFALCPNMLGSDNRFYLITNSRSNDQPLINSSKQEVAV